LLPIGDDNSQRRLFPVVTYALVATNILAFLLELAGGEFFVESWSFIPAQFAANPIGESITIFSSMFLHGGWLHLGGNMLYLLIFGDNVEDRFGHLKFLIFYLLCGLAASLAQFFVSMTSDIPTLGASGAIAGVLAAYLMMFPGRRVRVLVVTWIINMPALLVIGAWIVIQLISGVGTISSDSSSGGVAYMAHIGGFTAGLFLSLFFRKNARPVYY
jgi:membrane associated rhomboid family serine protease